MIRTPSWRISDRDCSTICSMFLDYMTPLQQKYTKENLFSNCLPSTFLPFHRTETLTTLKIRLWRICTDDLTTTMEPLWRCLCECRSEDAVHIVGLLDPQSVTAAELEQSNVLPFSVYRGWRTVVETLLKLANKMHFTPMVKVLALHEAIACQNHELLLTILEYDPDIDLLLPGGTALCAAVLSRKQDSVRIYGIESAL
jgi:hypothetical protein